MARGRTTPQARVNVSDLHEEHVSRDSFFGVAAMMYHGRATGNPSRVEGDMAVAITSVDPMQPDDGQVADGMPLSLLYSDEIEILISRRSEAMPFLFRHMDADTLYFIHKGEGVIATEFGDVPYEPGDFVLIPKAISYRVMPSSPMLAMIVESTDPIGFTEHRQVGRHAPFDPTVVFAPELTQYDWPHQKEWEVRMKHEGGFSSAFYDHLPFDLVGWKGDLFPIKINVRDIRPITSERLHLAPSSWSVFEARTFLCVTFLPMQVVSDPEAEELPTRHRNVDTDEAIFFRNNMGEPGEIFMHLPQGLTHGLDGEFRERYAHLREPGRMRVTNGVSIDTFKRLKRTPAFEALFKRR
ncbi:homogentisate 1,2-dioxygenase [Sphingobium sp.]|uniref:homogentisate 1,2-dioxygenase n=1 Tax=Sphingobium sp. TaxID=1912891 RepID=UPI0028BD2DFB|nr:homogentisate 1,2-dioxygenase [Sphingobium sp.]